MPAFNPIKLLDRIRREYKKKPGKTPNGLTLVGNTGFSHRHVFIGMHRTKTGKLLFKVTREPSEKRAKEIEIISNEWKRLGYPVQWLEVRRENWTYQPYAKGRTISEIGLQKLSYKDWRNIVRQVAELLAHMHSIHSPKFDLIQKSTATLSHVEEKFTTNIAIAVKNNQLTLAESKRAVKWLAPHRPKKIDAVVTHRDVNPTNTIYQKGKIFLIDLDPVLEIKDFELARTMEKMRMSLPLRKFFLKEYKKNGGEVTNLSDLPYWEACLCVQRLGTVYRELQKTTNSKIEIKRLKRRQTLLHKKLVKITRKT